MARIDMIGKKCGRLTVCQYSHTDTRRCIHWYCRCDCGNTVTVLGSSLRSGNTQSCGCLGRENRLKAISTHKRTRTPEHICWINMTQRCLNIGHELYPHYGGRGITVCDRWLKFENFYEDMGDRPSDKHSLDRIDNDGNYCPENCRWATKREQQNNRRVCRRYSLNGVTKSLAEWAETLKVNKGSLATRPNLGWTVEDMLTIPVNKRKKVHDEKLA